MDLLWLHILVVVCSIHHVFTTSKVTRKEEYDTFTSSDCMKCAKHGATPGETCAKDNCCKECKCGATAKTFYEKRLTQSCVEDAQIESDNGCQFYIAQKQNEQKHRSWIELSDEGIVKLGYLSHRAILIYPNGFKCKVKNVQYWNLVEWKSLDAKFIIQAAKKHVLKLDTDGKRSEYEGRLVKLKIKCSGNKDLESCTVFKFLGRKEYAANIGTPIKLPTKSPTKPPTPATKKEVTKRGTGTGSTAAKGKPGQRNTLIIIIIAVAATLLIVITGIVIWCCCWRKRKSKGSRNGATERRLLNHDGEDPNYQNPNTLPGRHSNEVNGSANNLMYLQPIDALPPNRYVQDNRPPKKKKSPNYDYPDIHSMSQKPNYPPPPPHSDSSAEKPIYAEVMDLKIIPDPEYTNPNLFMKPRTGTQIVGVPGYQPSSGPCSDSGDSHDGYSSLGVLSGEESTAYQSLVEANQSVHPPTPQYAEVVPEGNESPSPEPEEDPEISL